MSIMQDTIERQAVIGLLTKAYWMEIETVMILPRSASITPLTQDMAIRIQADEESHMPEFEGFLRSTNRSSHRGGCAA